MRCTVPLAAPLLLALLCACRGGIPEARFDAWDTRVAEAIERASAAKDATAVSASFTADAREQRVAQWDWLLQVLVLARAAGATAYLVDDPDSLDELERSLDTLMQRLAELERGRS